MLLFLLVRALLPWKINYNKTLTVGEETGLENVRLGNERGLISSPYVIFIIVTDDFIFVCSSDAERKEGSNVATGTQQEPEVFSKAYRGLLTKIFLMNFLLGS